MTRAQILPSLLIVIDLGAAGFYGLDGNWRLVIYWIAAAILTACVTY
jgi:hypothetical protein